MKAARQRVQRYRSEGGAADLVRVEVLIPPSARAEILSVASRLRADGKLFLYGPFKRDGVHTAPSNEAFDQSLKSRDPAWGVRDIADVEALAHANSLSLANIVPMPANNMILIFELKS